ncbi:MAG: sensor domain-containing diguanylate cyclase [Campylobacterota bacterium]
MRSLFQQFSKINIDSFLYAFDLHVDPVVITDNDLDNGVKILYVNKAFCSQTGYSEEEILGKSPKILQGKNSDRKTLRRLKKTLKEGKNFIGQTINYRKDGSEYIVQWSVAHLKDDRDDTVAYLSIQKILTRYATGEDEKLLLKSIVEHAPGMILVTNLEGIIIYVNQSFTRNTGYREDELLGKHTRMLKSGKQDESFYEKMWQSLIEKGQFEGLFISKKKDGSLFYDRKKITVIKDDRGNPKFYMAVSYDVTDEIETEKNLKQKAFTDALTGLHNKDRFELDIKEYHNAFVKNQNVFSLILLDIDHFKSINDNMGHDVGDFILKELAGLIKNNTRDDDKLYRWGGEEFILITASPLHIAEKIAQKLRGVIEDHDFNAISITASFGVAQIHKGQDTKALFKNADTALYEAKNSGRNRVVASDG